jgi:hypothetical protein
MRTGMATWAGGLLATLALLVVAAATAAGRIPQLAARTSIVAIGTAALAGGAFFVNFPSGMSEIHVDRGVFLFVFGLVAGAAAAILVLRANRAALARPAPG